MGLKEKLIGIAIKKIEEEVEKKIFESETVDKAIRSVEKTAKKLCGLTAVDELINEVKSEHYMVVKFDTQWNQDMVGEDGCEEFLAFDKNGEIKYKAYKGLSEIMRKQYGAVYDKNGNEIGTVRENLFNIAMPILEKVEKRVTAKLADGEEFCFEKSKSIGDKEFAISSYGGVLGVKQFKGRNYKLYQGKKRVAVIWHAVYGMNGFGNYFVVEYNRREDEGKIMLASVALYILE